MQIDRANSIIPQAIYRKDGEIVDPSPDSNVLIYHPHGYLSLPGTYSYNNKHTDESDSLILSESSYYEQERYCYSWENYILSHALINSHCIFFGWSGTDYSFRRILKNLEHRPKKIEDRKQFHYLIITVNSMYKTLLKHAKALKSMNIDSESDYIKNKMSAYLALKEEYWKSYGFLPIWTTYEELPKLIDELWM